MEFAPKALTDLLPEGLKQYALFITLGSLCVGSIIALLILLFVVRLLFGRGKGKGKEGPNLAEDLQEYPELKASTGDRQLRVEGVPVRIRLVIVAPGGTASEVEIDELPDLFEKIVPGLGAIYKQDKPRTRVWPTQVSYQGFGNHFHRNTITGADEGEQTRWVMIAGRVKDGKKQVMLGLGLQSIKPNTIGRRTIDSHEWASVLRVRVRD